MTKREIHAEIALKHPDIRGIVAAYNKLFSAIQELDALPTDLLQVLARRISDDVTSGAKLTEKQRFEFAEVWCPGEWRFRWRFS